MLLLLSTRPTTPRHDRRSATEEILARANSKAWQKQEHARLSRSHKTTRLVPGVQWTPKNWKHLPYPHRLYVLLRSIVWVEYAVMLRVSIKKPYFSREFNVVAFSGDYIKIHPFFFVLSSPFHCHHPVSGCDVDERVRGRERGHYYISLSAAAKRKLQSRTKYSKTRDWAGLGFFWERNFLPCEQNSQNNAILFFCVFWASMQKVA